MTDFYTLWDKSKRSPALLVKNHAYSVGTDEAPVFARLDEYDEAQPHAAPLFEGPLPEFLGYDDEGAVLSANAMPELTHTRTSTATRTFCGASLSPRRQLDDPWKAWSRTRSRALLGGARITRTGRGYTVFPEDDAVNKAILGCANKFIPASIDAETGYPCEDFRDLCAHLAECVETTADGSFSTHYLAKHATAYLRKMDATQTLSHDQLHQKKRTNP